MLATESVYDVTFIYPNGEILCWAETAVSSDRALLLAVADLIGTDREFDEVTITVKRR